ncbi:hypothetical protein LTR95_008524 [Oleoguttula sp. CCFEE 5521]
MAFGLKKKMIISGGAEQVVQKPNSEQSSGNPAQSIEVEGAHPLCDITAVEKDHVEELEKIQTIERVGTNAQYYEKDGMRTEGDGFDHVGAHQKMTPKLFMALVTMAFLWVGSQIPLYLFGSVVTTIYADIGGLDRWVWFVVGYLIPVAALCPFAGALSDLFGRKYVALGGQVFLMIGPIVTSTAQSMNVAIGGQVLSGIGAGLNELISLTGTGEMVPTAKRSIYVGMVVLTILPFAPSLLWAQLITRASSWRYLGTVVGGWNLAGFVLVIFCYNPPPRPNSKGYSQSEILRRIDYIGGLLSIGGILCFLLGLQWSTSQYKWHSAHVLTPFILGILLIASFFVWEMRIARYPMVPHRIFVKAKRTMTIILLITFLSGANFFAVLLLWPSEIYNVYGNDPVQIGVRGLPIGFGILTGAVICLILIPITGGRIRLLLIFWTAVMTAGTGAMSVGTPHNIDAMLGLVTLASIGVGAIIIPCSIIAQICCPDDLIATITAITLSIRYVGGAIGFTIYYSVFYHKLIPNLTRLVAIDAIVGQLHCYNVTQITEFTTLIGNAEFTSLEELINTTGQAAPNFYSVVVSAAQVAFAESYAYPYYISIAFGATTMILAFFLGDISQFLDDHIAVVSEV